METIFTLDNAIVFITLTILELVLGIDNLIFISILSSKLQKIYRQGRAQLGYYLQCLSELDYYFRLLG